MYGDILLQRLSIAREFGDKAAERRAYSNLGNAHIFQGEFDVAAAQYKSVVNCLCGYANYIYVKNFMNNSSQRILR